jgi:hypothetical protein
MAASWIAAIAALASAATGAYSAANPPKSKLSTTGEASGGAPNPQAQDVFSQGALRGETAPLPNVTAPQQDLSIGQILANLGSGQAAPQVPYSPLLQEPTPGSPTSKTDPTAAGKTGLEKYTSIGGDVAQALAAVGPLLFPPDTTRPIAMGPVAGGGGNGPPVFQLPQRNTLAQILASLPRTM